MKLLTTHNGSYLSGTEIVDAVLAYGLALARRGDLDVVDVPFVDDEGEVRRVELTVGWQTDVLAISSIAPGEELLEPQTVLALHGKADTVGVLRAREFSDENLLDIRREMEKWEDLG